MLGVYYQSTSQDKSVCEIILNMSGPVPKEIGIVTEVDQQEEDVHRKLEEPLGQLGHKNVSTKPVGQGLIRIEGLKDVASYAGTSWEEATEGSNMSTGDRATDNSNPISLAQERFKRMRPKKEAA